VLYEAGAGEVNDLLVQVSSSSRTMRLQDTGAAAQDAVVSCGEGTDATTQDAADRPKTVGCERSRVDVSGR
jgi:predicted phage gp36 major capsid-like protein